MHDTNWIAVISMWLFWLIVIGGAVLLIRWLAGWGRKPEIDESPEAILERRYERGDISRQEYERRLKELRH